MAEKKGDGNGAWRANVAFKTPQEFISALASSGMPDAAILEWVNFITGIREPLYAAIAQGDAVKAAMQGIPTPKDYYSGTKLDAKLPSLNESAGAGRFAAPGGMGVGGREPYGMPASSQKLIDMLMGGGR